MPAVPSLGARAGALIRGRARLVAVAPTCTATSALVANFSPRLRSLVAVAPCRTKLAGRCPGNIGVLASGAMLARARRSKEHRKVPGLASGAIVVGLGLAPLVVTVRASRTVRARLACDCDQQRAVVRCPCLAHFASRQALCVGKSATRARFAS